MIIIETGFTDQKAYLVTKGKFIPSSLQLIVLFIEVHILVKSLLVDMTKLLQLLIAVMKQLLQQQPIFSLVPIFFASKKDELTRYHRTTLFMC